MPDDVVKRLSEAVDAEPNRRLLRLELASALLHVGRFAEALDHTRKVLAVWPGDPKALGLAAMACELSGDASAGAAYAALMRRQATQSAQAGAVEASSSDQDLIVDPLLGSPAPVDHEQLGLTIPLLSLVDVIGATEEKRRLDSVLVQPVRHRTSAAGAAAIPSGLVLYGPRGSGKSHLAHALAGELHLNLVKVNVAAAIDPWGAALPGAIQRAHELAMANAPAMLLLEDLEAVGHRRLRFTPRGCEALDELLGVLERNDPSKVVIVGATSAPWMVNPVLRGAGRFDHSVLIGPPDVEARSALLERLVRTRMIPVLADMEALAARTEGCTTDDLSMLFSLAAELAFRDVADKGTIVAIADRHFDHALGRLRRSANEWFDTAYNFPEFTDDSAEFDPLFDYIRRNVRRLG